jgi:SAM-dependent methyltransferase
MTFCVVNLNEEFPEGRFDAVLANHSLHHFVELEYIFDSVKESLSDEGVFVISDMIGRNGHMRWPEALVFVEQLWDFLPAEKKFNNFAKCFEQEYVNYDCTLDDTFEGIRAQDILPLLLDRFHFEKFVGHGGVIDIFIDRIYGNNFSPENDADRKFIDYVEGLNTLLIDARLITPTAMFATLSKRSGGCRFSRWSPQSALRRPIPKAERDPKNALESEIRALRNSTSWRITAPMRALATLFRR